MGCGASKNDVIKSASSDMHPKNKSSSAASEASTIPAHDGDMYQQNGKPSKILPPLKPVRNPREKPPEPVAFEVPAFESNGDTNGDDLIKKHPPRRLRQLEEKAPETSTLTEEEIQEKVALANKRRDQVLTQRIASARQKSARGGRSSRRPVIPMEQPYDMTELDGEMYGMGDHHGGEGMGGGGFGGGFGGGDF